MIPGFVSGPFFFFFGVGGGGVSRGVYQFYLDPHKSGKREKYSYSNSLQHAVSIMRTLSNTHMKQQGVLLDLLTSTSKYQEKSGRAATQNRNKNDYAWTVETYMHDTTK